MSRLLTAICFDLFDTLISFDDDVYDTTRRNIENTISIPYKQFDDVWRACRAPADTNGFQSIDDRVKHVLSRLGVDSEQNCKQVLETEKLSLHLACSCIYGVHDVLNWAHDSGINLGLISNASAAGLYLLNAMNLASYFRASIFSFRDGVKKPSLDAYLLACSRLDSKPEETVYIADGSLDELEGAHHAGLFVIRFDPMSRHRDRQVGFPDFDRSDSLLCFLKRLRSSFESTIDKHNLPET